MAIFLSAASVIALAAPQQPAELTPTATPSEVTASNGESQPFIHARAFPETTALLLTWNARAEAPWARVVESLPEHIAGSIPRMLEQLARQAELTQDEVSMVRRASYSFGVMRGTDANRTDLPWLLVAEFEDGASDAIIAALQRTTDAGPDNDAQRVWSTMSPLVGSLAFGRLDNQLYFASDPTAIDAALARVEGTVTATRSVLNSQRFRRFLDQCGDDGTSNHAFAAVYVDVIGVLDSMRSLVPAEHRPMFVKGVEALQLRQIFALGYIAHDVDGAVFEHSRICFPKPRSGLPSLLTVAPTLLEPSLADFVPADAASFALFHIDADRLLEESFVLIQSIDADYGAQARAIVSQIGRTNNIDFQQDVFAALGRRVATIQWPAQGGMDEVLVWSLRNPIAIGKALRGTSQFKASVIDGFELYRHPSGVLTIAVGDDDLLLSRSDARLQSVIANWRNKTPNPHVTALLASAPTSTTALLWTDTATVLLEMLSVADEYGQGMPPGLRSELEGVLPMLGHANTTITTDEQGLSLRSQSRFGAPGIAAMLGVTIGMSVVGEADPNLALSSPIRRAAFAARLGGLARVLVAQPSSTTLEDLVTSDALPANLLDGEWTKLDQHIVGGYRLKLIRDEANPSLFALVAWPDNIRRGDVYCCANSGVPMVNEVLTHVAGIERLSVRDVFHDGRIASAKFAAGWEPIDQTNGDRPSRLANPTDVESTIPTQFELSTSDWAIYQSLVAAERGDRELETSHLIELVGNTNPAIAARAAHTIGVLKIRDAVPSLCELALELTDLATRRQVMQTLFDLRDPRAVPVARVSLTDPDRTIRALCAKMVGRAKDKAAVQGLLDVLVREAPTDADVDRTQALLSLADLGDAACIESAASSPLAGDSQEQALAYLLQQLSPKLAPDREVATLLTILSHESMIVRRYAIRRLGELRDPISVAALERHLANEGPELRPIVEVALSAVRGPTREQDPADNPQTSSGAATDWRSWVAKAKTWVRGLDKRTRNIYLASSAGAALVLFGLVIGVLRRRRRAKATDWSTMTAPSEELAEGYDYQHADGGALDDTAAPIVHDEFYDDHPVAENVSGDFGAADRGQEFNVDEVNEWGPPSR